MSSRNIGVGQTDASVFMEIERGVTNDAPQAILGLRGKVSFSDYLVLTTLPRGGMQIVRSGRADDSLTKSYGRNLFHEDRLNWQVLRDSRAARSSDVWKDQSGDGSRFVEDFLQPLGVRFAASAPLNAPVLPGYPGVLTILRTAEQGDFTDAELETLNATARQLDEELDRSRTDRGRESVEHLRLPHRLDMRHFVFAADGAIVIGAETFDALDPSLRTALRQTVVDAAGDDGRPDGEAVRQPLADSHGDLWNFNIVLHREFPALGEGAFVLACLQPECAEWAQMHATDFRADVELARLVPAAKFMQENYRESPTLTQIAAIVHLSPFHFHRRFTELLGITPKHFLLDCQISEAKRQLVSRQQELADIAKYCGFAHQSHFTSRFKQATGLTPTRWRRLATDGMSRAVVDEVSN